MLSRDPDCDASAAVDTGQGETGVSTTTHPASLRSHHQLTHGTTHRCCLVSLLSCVVAVLCHCCLVSLLSYVVVVLCRCCLVSLLSRVVVLCRCCLVSLLSLQWFCLYTHIVCVVVVDVLKDMFGCVVSVGLGCC